MTSLVLIPHLAENLKTPVIAAGGFADGRGIAAALALGAEGVAMGTRLMTIKESSLNNVYFASKFTNSSRYFSDRLS